MSVVIETTKGIFTVDLFIDERPKGKNIRNITLFQRKNKKGMSPILSDNISFFFLIIFSLQELSKTMQSQILQFMLVSLGSIKLCRTNR